MTEEERLNELMKVLNTNEKLKEAFFYNMVKHEKIYGDFLFSTHYDINLNDKKYKDIKIISITCFSLDGLNKLIEKRDDIKILIKFPINFSNEEKNELFNNKEKYKNVFFIDDAYKEFSIDDLIKIEKSMDLMVKDIKESDLSPYERFIAVYDIVKSYKSYKEEPDESFHLSRNVYMFILSDYGVCIGYTNFLQALLLRVDIPCDDLICNGDHAILVSYIKDSKYNINSFQLSDPTSDAIRDDFKQLPLTQSYMHLNMTFEEAERNYGNVEIMPFIKEDNPNKMLEYLKYKFGKVRLQFIFNKLANLFGNEINVLDSEDQVMNVFKELLSSIGEDSSKYNIETAKKVINYIKNKTRQKIDLDSRLMAIYNVYNYVNNEASNNFADFVRENFSFKNFFMGNTLSDRIDMDESIDNLSLEQLVGGYINFSSVYINADSVKDFSFENFNKIIYLYYIENALFNLGVVYYNGDILLRNSLFSDYDDISSLCDKDSRLKYDSELNNLYLVINNDMIHMKFKDFKNYINELVSNINSKRR